MKTLSQQYRHPSEWPYQPDWHVHRISLSVEARQAMAAGRDPLAVSYPFWIDVSYDSGRSYWNVSSVEEWRYDLTATTFAQEVLAAFGLADPPLCCWCDNVAGGDPVWYAGVPHPACAEHSRQYRQPIFRTNEDFDRVNLVVRQPQREEVVA